VVFVGSFLANGERKFVRQVEQRTFSGREAWARGQPVLYVTERCVFRLHARGLELIEVAPGVDIERDILAHMDFRPVIEGTPKTMEAGLFAEAAIGLRARLLLLPLADRLHYDVARNTLFIDFERLRLRSPQDVAAVQQAVEQCLAPLGRKVYAVVNYDHCVIDPEVQDLWAAMVRELLDRHYLDVSRYSSSAFLRARLGPALAARGVPPHLYASAEEARQRVGQAPE
jgi:propionate CoA-transferase